MDLDAVKVGWWTAYCCEEDLEQITTEEDLKRFLEEAREWIEDEGFSRREFWPTREAALAGLGDIHIHSAGDANGTG